MDNSEKPAAKSKKRIAWMPLPGGYDYLEKAANAKSQDEFLSILLEGQNAGALVILGITDQDPRDFLACAQEFGDFKMIVDDRKFPAGDAE